MNVLSLWTMLPFLDQVIEPQADNIPDTSFTGVLLIILVLFLAFVGCLIWSALKNKK